MAADIVSNTLSTADLSFRRMIELVHEDNDSGKLSKFSWGSVIDKFSEWARGIRMAPLRTKDGKHREEDKETFAAWKPGPSASHASGHKGCGTCHGGLSSPRPSRLSFFMFALFALGHGCAQIA